ncbi:hypothetical protein [Nocardia australiensis]|uniref:hypothetical protein n=1 Tax=Nocardia australiensis TaxID=2887191 RepID=UPI001D14AC74|nr:hypothetical protein [Nocardia australiensis]
MTVEQPVREKAVGPALGMRRVQRYAAAFDWVLHCIDRGCYLEAIAVLDSLISDRLASRVSYIRRQEPHGVPTVGTLCSWLLNGHKKNENPRVEHDPEFRAVIADIENWSKARNKAMHQTTKIFHNNDLTISFNDVPIPHRETATTGVQLLRRFDELDTQARPPRGSCQARSPTLSSRSGVHIRQHPAPRSEA